MGSDAASLALAVSGTLVDLQMERGLLLAHLAAERLDQARRANDQAAAATGKVAALSTPLSCSCMASSTVTIQNPYTVLTIWS